MLYLQPLEAREVLLVKYTFYECLYHWWGCCLVSSLVSTLAALVRLLVSAEVRHYGGGLVPQEHVKPVDLSNLASYETMVRLSEQGVKVLELNLPIYPLAEESVLLSLSALLWTCKVWKKGTF